MHRTFDPINNLTPQHSNSRFYCAYLSETTGDDGLAQLGGEDDMSGNELITDGEEEFQSLPVDDTAGEELPLGGMDEEGMDEDMEGSDDEGGTCAEFKQCLTPLTILIIFPFIMIRITLVEIKGCPSHSKIVKTSSPA